MAILDQSEPQVLNMHNGFEIYPMPMFAGMETPDVNVLVQWYQAALGFGIVFKAPGGEGQPTLVHLRRRKYQDVLIRPTQPGSETIEVGGWSLCLQSGEDVDQLAVRAAAVPVIGMVRIEPAADTPWNTRPVRMIDPDGRQLVFSQPRFDAELTNRPGKLFEADRAAGQ
ncbi:MAG TPA: hypothetical protein VIY90_22610 [Steroidobacteraceae bacterium]